VSECAAIRNYGDHLYAHSYSRPWWNLFRKTYWLRCWHCDLRVMDPCEHQRG